MGRRVGHGDRVDGLGAQFDGNLLEQCCREIAQVGCAYPIEQLCERKSWHGGFYGPVVGAAVHIGTPAGCAHFPIPRCIGFSLWMATPDTCADTSSGSAILPRLASNATLSEYGPHTRPDPKITRVDGR